MQILATYKHNMGGVFKLAKVSDDFFMYGTQKEFDSLGGVSSSCSLKVFMALWAVVQIMSSLWSDVSAFASWAASM